MSKRPPLRSALKRAARTQPFVPPQNWRYGACESHRAHKSRAAAKRAVREHGGYPCWKCSNGYRIDWFVCPQSPAHFHIGHSRVVEQSA